MKNIILIAFVAALAFGCSAQHNSISNSEWKLTEMNGQKIDSKVLITLKLIKENGSITGSGGCNQYYGTYIQNNDQITFNVTGTTKMFCDETMNYEDEFIRTLKNQFTIKQEGENLLLSKDNNIILKFIKKQ